MALDFASSTSSPDPLGNSTLDTIDHLIELKRAPSTTPKKPLQDAHGNIKLQDFYLDTPTAGILRKSSPTKSVARAENLISPWRIHVTVEAEREGLRGTRMATPTSPIRTMIQDRPIVKVPVKGLENSSPAPMKRGRGRPRKSLDGPAKPKGTPHPAKRRKTQGAISKEEKDSPGISKAASPKKPKGRLRKSVEFDSDTEDMLGDRNMPSKAMSSPRRKRQLEPTPTKPKAKGRMEAATPSKQSVSSSSNALNNVDQPIPSKRQKTNSTNEGFGLPSPEPTVSAAASPKARRQLLNKDPTPKTVPSVINNGLNEQRLSNNVQNMLSKGEGWEGWNERRLGDPTDEHREYDSIIESEGFSMVTASSLPSAKQFLGTDQGTNDGMEQFSQSLERESKHPEIEAPQLRERDRTTRITKDDEHSQENISLPSEKPQISPSSTVEEASETDKPRIPPSMLNQSLILPHLTKTTPSKSQSSPTLPPSVQVPSLNNAPRHVDKSSDGTPKLARVVRAGIVLEGVTRSDSQSSKSQIRPRGEESAVSIKSPQDRLDDRFSGFGAGTRRELRAGLRLGEELAKRHELALQAAASTRSPKDDIFQDSNVMNRKSPTPDAPKEYARRIPSNEGEIRYPTLPTQQLPSPENSEMVLNEDRMSWRADTRAKAAINSETGKHVSSDTNSTTSDIDETKLRREAEWQREREAVIRQIEEANTSQVIVIEESRFNEEESDEDVEYDDGYDEELNDGEETDIWQAEANSSDHQVKPFQTASESLFPEQVIKPRRSKLPSLWRKQNQVVYSDETAHSQEQELKRSSILKTIITPIHKQSSRNRPLNFSALSDSISFEPDDMCSTVAARFRYLESGAKVASEDRNGEYNVDGMDMDETAQKTKSTDESDDPDGPTSPSPVALNGRSHQSTAPRAQFHSVFKETSQQSISTNPLQGLARPSLTKPIPPRKVAQDPVAFPQQSVPNNSISQGPSRPSQPELVPPKKIAQGPITSPKILHRTNPLPPSWFTRITEFISPLTSIIPRDVPGDQLPIFPVTELPFRPLSWFTPWTDSHHSHLRTLYLRTQKNPVKHPLRRWSRSACLRGSVVSNAGWEKRVAEWELFVVDEYMDLLQTWGVDDRVKEIDERPRAQRRKRIDEEEVLKRVFGLWVGQVIRKGVTLGEGEKLGVLDSRLERIPDRRVL
ncbi:hypothetical protein MMC14_003316 [Varicellaria rhodocarpa]|nr:hypothetical protein [Varicellaria rhodocarpa]